MSDDPSIRYFPTGLSVNRAKRRAKASVKAGSYQTLTEALDAISVDQTGLPWGKALPNLTTRTHDHSHSTGHDRR